MSLLVRSDQTKYFEFLKDLPNEVLVEFCKLSFEYLNSGPNEKKYKIASDKLNQTPEFIQSTVESLVFFLIESIKFNVLLSEFETLNTLGFNSDQIDILWQFIKNKEENLKNIISCDKQLHFRELEWRLETRIASRSLLYQVTPSITMKLHLDREGIPEIREKLDDIPNEDGSSKKQVLLQIDPSSLRHTIESLEAALQASKSHRSRVFCKAFQPITK